MMRGFKTGSVALTMLGLNACNNSEGTEKFQKHRDNIVNVEERITDIKTDVLLGSKVVLDIIEDYLIVTDIQSVDKGIHLFNKNTFEYITSTGILGRGPGEIAMYGLLIPDSDGKGFWLTDYVNKVMWKFPLDSILHNEKFKPTEKINLNTDFLIGRSNALNDSIILGKGINVIGQNSSRKSW